MKCRICIKEAANEYCRLHERAHRNVMDKFEEWRRALDISWKEYLNEVAKNPYTGSSAKEVAEQLLSETE
jgi:hypothetical protein